MGPREFSIQRWYREEIGQDLSEYCLIIALVMLAAAGILVKVSGGIQNLWTAANTTLANTSVSTSATTAADKQ
jgi:Flp pilus assembly pilin Flp